MKKLLTFAACLLTLPALTFSASGKEHVVERGESLGSIAKAYGITVEKILELNPSAGTLFYSGMVLELPDSSVPVDAVSQTETKELKSTNQANPANPEYGQVESSKSNPLLVAVNNSQDEEEDQFYKGRNYFGFKIAYLFPEGGVHTNIENPYGTSSSSTISMEYTLKAGRYFIKNLFAQAELGFGFNYTSTTSRTLGSKEDSSSSSYYIPLSVHGGYSLPFGKHFGIRAFTGPTARFNVASNRKINDKPDENYEHKFSVTGTWDFGAELVLWGWNAGFDYQINLNAPSGGWNVYLGFMF